MQQNFNKISDRIAALFSGIFNLVHTQPNHQIEHQCLARHIIDFNKKQSSAQIINEAALCLRNTLNYRLFAFVIKREDGIDAWLDPSIHKKSIEKIILKDFSLESIQRLNYLNQSQLVHIYKFEKKFNMDDLIIYDLKEKNCYTKIYFAPDYSQLSFDGDLDLVKLVLQGAVTALSRLIKIKNLKSAAVIDPLTGCYNRREFINQLKRNIAGAIRHKNSLSIFMFDLDHFKRVNDTYGHLAGDKVLQEIVSLVQKNMRTNDIFARYGGEEFIAILPATDKIKAMELADRLRDKISKKVIAYKDDTIKVTASFGVAQMDLNAGMEKIIQDADTMLYKAKLNGRNIVMPGLIKIIPNQVLAKG
jgi:diguanylate cyclase (GGDEF)-like protein